MENHAIMLIVALSVVPMLLCGIYAFLTRPSKYYYRHNGTRWIRKR